MSSDNANTDPLDMANLQENFNKQQEKISALKELVRKSESVHNKSTSNTHEKVKSIAQRLNHLKSKAHARHNMEESFTEFTSDDTVLEEETTPNKNFQISSPQSRETRSSEKMQLLKEQVERNKMKLAEREINKRELEEKVTQIKARIDITQQNLEKSTEFGRSMGDLTSLFSTPIKSKYRSDADLSSDSPLDLDKDRIQFLENRIRVLERELENEKNIPKSENEAFEKISDLQNKILDLEENIKEKDSIIEAKTQAVGLVTENLSAKSRTVVDTLEDTKQEMLKMQERFLEIEHDYKQKIEHLTNELEKFRLSSTQVQNAENENKVEELREDAEESFSKNTEQEYLNRIENLEKENNKLKEERKNLEILLENNTKSEHENNVEANQTNCNHEKEIQDLLLKISTLEDQLTEKTIENNVLNANLTVLQEKLRVSTPKPLFPKSVGDDESDLEVNKLKSQLDESNKSMIKMKLKMKQLQKQLDSFKKISDVNKEVVRLREENQNLQQKLSSVEEEKGDVSQLKSSKVELHTVDEDELKKKIQILETTCQNQTSAIQLLEEQKLDMMKNLNRAEQELESLKEIDRQETVRVVSHMEVIQLEEQISDLQSQIKELHNVIDNQKQEIYNLNENIQALENEKITLNKKIDHYVVENIELIDKMEKLSKSSSSAESIEIVERLTQQEKLEIEEFNNKDGKQDQITSSSSLVTSSVADNIIIDDENNVMEQELSENLTKLNEESSELMHKIELFTAERHEVLEKMENLTDENQKYVQQISQLLEEKSNLENKLEKSINEIGQIKEDYRKVTQDKNSLLKEIEEMRISKNQITEELNSLLKKKYHVSDAFDLDNVIRNCEKCLNQVKSELDNYKKSIDKRSKLNTSRKLAKEAENAYQQLKGLLEQLKTNVETSSPIIPTPITTLNSINSIELIHKCEEIENVIADLQTELNALKSESEQKDSEIQRLNLEIENKDEVDHLNKEINGLRRIRRELENQLDISNKEINILKMLVSEQKEELINTHKNHEIELTEKLELIDHYENEIDKLKSELSTLQSEKAKLYSEFNEKLQMEVEKLQNLLKTNENSLLEQSKELANKQETIDHLNKQVIDLYKTIEEKSNKILEKDDEIMYINDLLEANKNELDRMMKNDNENKRIIEELQERLDSNKSVRSEALKSFEMQNNNLDARVKELEKSNAELTTRNKELLEKLKKFASNLKKKANQCTEMEKKINELESNLEATKKSQTLLDSSILEISTQDYKAKITSLEAQNQEYQTEYNRLKSVLTEQTQYYKEEIAELRNEISEKNQALEKQHEDYEALLENFHLKCDNMEKQLEIEKQLNYEFQLQIEDNLRHTKEKDDKINSLLSEVSSKNVKIEKCKAILKEKNKEIQKLVDENNLLKQSQMNMDENKLEENRNLQARINQLEEENLQLMRNYESEKMAFQNTIHRLESVHGGIQAKLQEDAGYIESLEMQNNQLKDKITRLENCIASVERRRSTLEFYIRLLGSQFNEETDEYKKSDDPLLYRLNMLFENDEIIVKRFLEIEKENEQMKAKLNYSKDEYNELLQKFSSIESELQQFKNERYEVLKTENEVLKQQLEVNQNELIKIQQNFDEELTRKHMEIGEMQERLNIQLQKVLEEKCSLEENYEKTKSEMRELVNENSKFKETINELKHVRNDLERENSRLKVQVENLTQEQHELRTQLIQNRSEIDNLTNQIDILTQNHEIELNVLKTQINELDSMRMQVSQNQTDDQVFIETENKKLRELLAEKDALIENYQRQNLQLQMTISSAASSTMPSTQKDLQSLFNMPPSTSQANDQFFSDGFESIVVSERHQVLENEPNHQSGNMREVVDDLTRKYSELQSKYVEKQNEIDALKEHLKQFNQPQQEVFPVFNTEMAAVPSTFNDKKIEDLERNVSDLEKHAADLENKLRHLTSVHEEHLNQMHERNRIHEQSVKEYEDKIRKLEERIVELQITNPAVFVVSDMKAAKDNGNQTDKPVEEEPIIPSRAYVCQPDINDPLMLSNNDWIWGSEHANLEENHYQLNASQNETNHSNQVKSLENKLKEYQERIQELELERNSLENQKIELQVKSGKMLKKLKEYKNQVEKLKATSSSFNKSPSVESNDLDFAIQEELKSQLDISEKKLVEMKKHLEKELLEKENLLKRIEVLTDGNARLMEMKEKQDMNMQIYQSEISRLNDRIKNLNDWGGSGTSPDKNKESEITDDKHSKILCSNCSNVITDDVTELKQELESLKADKDELQALLNEETENNKLHEEKHGNLQQKIMKLQQELDDEKEKRKNNNFQMDRIHQTNQDMQSQLNEYQATINRLTSEVDSLKSQLQKLNVDYKNKLSENSDLIMKLNELNVHNNQLLQEAQSINREGEFIQEIDQLKSKINEFESTIQYKNDEIHHLKQKVEKLIENDDELHLQKEELLRKNQEIGQLTQINQQLQSENQNLTQQISAIQNTAVDCKCLELKNEVESLQIEIKSLQTEKSHMEEELEVLNNHVMENQGLEEKMKQFGLELDLKNIEISELKNSLDILKQQQSQSEKCNCSEKLNELNAQWEKVIEQKCKEINENWQQRLADKEMQCQQIEKKLKEKLNSFTQTSSDNNNIEEIAEGSDYNAEIQKLQSVLESQELEIVTLKEQLAVRSAEYASLAARHDPYGQKTSNSVFDIKFTSSKPADKVTENVNLVPKAELDIALYKLYEREMRNEELKFELVHLLEERDTLQLKLSNALRQIEECKLKTQNNEDIVDSDSVVSFLDGQAKYPQESENTSINVSQDSNELSAKLSQLHALSQSEDKHIQDERDQRQIQVEQVQQNVANIPTEGVSEFVGGNLSNIIESQSTTLLNWLWGSNSRSSE